MTSAVFKFKPQPDIQKLFEWREQLSGSLKYNGAEASIEFEISVDDKYFRGDSTASWNCLCEWAVNEHVKECCPELHIGDVTELVALEIYPEAAPDEVKEQEQCDRWARSVRGCR